MAVIGSDDAFVRFSSTMHKGNHVLTIHHVYVSPCQRGQGWGRKLIDALVAWIPVCRKSNITVKATIGSQSGLVWCTTLADKLHATCKFSLPSDTRLLDRYLE